MEIERKWMVSGWPSDSYAVLAEEEMEQGYLVVRPTVRIRKEALRGGETNYILCIKKGDGLVREEIEIGIPKEKYEDLKRVIGLPMIRKIRRKYQLPDGHILEVNHVDEGLDTEFWYAEIEYAGEEEARNWKSDDDFLKDYLSDDVTWKANQSMGAYWLRTREKVIF